MSGINQIHYLSSLELECARLEANRLIGEDGSEQKRYRRIVSRSGLLATLVFHEKIVLTCNKFLGRGWKCSSAQIHVLPPGFSSYSWHVDYPYFNLTSWDIESPLLSYQFIWCLDDFSSTFGSLAIGALTNKPVNDRKIMPEQFNIIEAPAGALFSMDPRIIHSTSPNNSKKIRRALLVSMVRQGIDPMEEI